MEDNMNGMEVKRMTWKLRWMAWKLRWMAWMVYKQILKATWKI